MVHLPFAEQAEAQTPTERQSIADLLENTYSKGTIIFRGEISRIVQAIRSDNDTATEHLRLFLMSEEQCSDFPDA